MTMVTFPMEIADMLAEKEDIKYGRKTNVIWHRDVGMGVKTLHLQQNVYGPITDAANRLMGGNKRQENVDILYDDFQRR